MFDRFPRYDMERKPNRPGLRLLQYLLSVGDVKKHKCKVIKTNVGDIKPPYIILANHNAFLDINTLSYVTYPHKLNYVIAIDGFIGREWLLRTIGGICKRKFTTDPNLIKQIKYCIDHKWVVAMFPEARYSLCGTKAIIPASVARLCKYLNVPVVMLRMHGHHINSPFWNLTQRNVKPTEAELFCLVSKHEIESIDVQEIDDRIQEAFIYDEYEWQKKNNIHVAYEGRAEGLHKVLYKCPHCGKEYRMNSKGIYLYCEECGKKWEYSELGELKATEGETEFSHIPDWYEWERDEVRKEVEAGTYKFEGEVHVSMLPNVKEFIPIGNAYLVHDMNGFKLTGEFEGEKYEVVLPAQKTYGVHIEYEYLGKYGDCVDLNTLDNTFYVYPHGRDFAVTKFSLATEELYKYYHKNDKR